MNKSAQDFLPEVTIFSAGLFFPSTPADGTDKRCTKDLNEIITKKA